MLYDAIRNVFNSKLQKPREEESDLESAAEGFSWIAFVLKNRVTGDDIGE